MELQGSRLLFVSLSAHIITHIIRLVDMQLSPSQSRAQRSLSPLVTQAKGDRFLTESISQQITLKLTNH